MNIKISKQLFLEADGSGSFLSRSINRHLKALSSRHKNIENSDRLDYFNGIIMTKRFAVIAGMTIFVFSASQPTHSASYSKEAMLHGAVQTTGVSGYTGTPFSLKSKESDQAIYGLFSVEKRDNPCYLAVRTESINDSSIDDGATKDLCSGKATSKELGVAFEDSSFHGKRVFVNGLRVCMNKDETRVKGLQIRGKKIDKDAHPVDLDSGNPVAGQAGGSDVSLHMITEPRDERKHCKSWKKWVECPSENQIATGLIAHFEAGQARRNPRSLTGIALECRHASGLYVVR